MEVTAGADELQRARLLLSAKRYQDAVTLASQCSAARPGDPQPLMVLAWAEMGLRRFDAAEEAAREAVGFAPTLIDAHRTLVAVLTNRAFASTNRYLRGVLGRRAVRAAKQMVRLAPTDVASYWVLADACVSAFKARPAVAAANTALELAPNLMQTWLIRARAARIAHDYPVAEASVREALRMEPDNYLANNELGVILRLRGRTPEALRQFASTASMDPVARPARGQLLRYGALPFLVLTLIATSPLLIALKGQVTVWLWGSIILNAVLWRIKPTKRILERRALAMAMWRSRHSGRRSKRREALVPPATPIQPYRSNLWVSIAFLVVLGFIALIATGGIATSAPAFLPLTLLVDAPTVALGWFVLKRLKPRPTVFS